MSFWRIYKTFLKLCILFEAFVTLMNYRMKSFLDFLGSIRVFYNNPGIFFLHFPTNIAQQIFAVVVTCLGFRMQTLIFPVMFYFLRRFCFRNSIAAAVFHWITRTIASWEVENRYVKQWLRSRWMATTE